MHCYSCEDLYAFLVNIYLGAGLAELINKGLTSLIFLWSILVYADKVIYTSYFINEIIRSTHIFLVRRIGFTSLLDFVQKEVCQNYLRKENLND